MKPVLIFVAHLHDCVNLTERRKVKAARICMESFVSGGDSGNTASCGPHSEAEVTHIKERKPQKYAGFHLDVNSKQMSARNE